MSRPAVLLLEPHHDDAVLFACYQLIRWRPIVVTVFGDARVQNQYGITGPERSLENRLAFAKLGLDQGDWKEWKQFSDADVVDHDLIFTAMEEYDLLNRPELVLAPLPEVGGHDQHTAVGNLAHEAFAGRVYYYATYVRGQARSRTADEVEPGPGWAASKYRALSCYRSQINLENCRPWFAAADVLREWVA